MEPAQVDTFDITINYKGIDIICNVNYQTACELLNDPEAAEKYAEEILRLNNNNKTDTTTNKNESETSNDINSGTTVWSSKMKTDADHDATSLLLTCRNKYSSRFNDRKTLKNGLWQKIADEMNAAGFYVGTGKDGAERCRQKFANLQRAYIQHIHHMKRTGEKKKDAPPFFAELHDILGQKDKIDPPFLEDSLDGNKENENEEFNNVAVPSTSKEEIKNRFAATKRSLRPNPSAQILEELKRQHAEEQQQREKHFTILQSALDKQNEQRDKLLEILQENLSRNKQRKRRHSLSSSSDE